MRLDKFLKVSRIIKRRTVANEACDAGKVVVNGKQARGFIPAGSLDYPADPLFDAEGGYDDAGEVG